MHFYVWSILWNEDDCRDCVGEWGKGHWAEGSLLSIRCFSHCYVLFMCNDKNLNIKPIICINAIIESMKRTKTTKQINSRKYWCKDFSQKPWLLLTAVHVSSPAQEEPLLKPPSCAPPPPPHLGLYSCLSVRCPSKGHKQAVPERTEQTQDLESSRAGAQIGGDCQSHWDCYCKHLLTCPDEQKTDQGEVWVAVSSIKMKPFK